jgi:hypothetical protein
MSSKTQGGLPHGKNLTRALERIEITTHTVTLQEQRGRKSKKGEGGTTSLLKDLPEGRMTKARRGIPRRLLLLQQQNREESGSPP